MASIKDEKKNIYQSVDKKTGIIYEVSLYMHFGEWWIDEMTITNGSEIKTNPMVNLDINPNTQEDLMKFYTNLSKKKFVEFMETISSEVISKFTKKISTYVGGQCDEEYSCYVDNFGNLIMVTQYVYHYLHCCSSTYRYVADCDLFKRNLIDFCKYLYRDQNKYQKFFDSLNRKTLNKYFKKSYVVK